ncbi:unnamed protein product [Boreogadus saida]
MARERESWSKAPTSLCRESPAHMFVIQGECAACSPASCCTRMHLLRSSRSCAARGPVNTAVLPGTSQLVPTPSSVVDFAHLSGQNKTTGARTRVSTSKTEEQGRTIIITQLDGNPTSPENPPSKSQERWITANSYIKYTCIN